MSARERLTVSETNQDMTPVGDFCKFMLVADGEPQHGGLPPLSHGHEPRSAIDGLYGRQRERVIIEAAESAKQCGSRQPIYIMTTGYGAVPLDSVLNIYNVPGQLSIQRLEYRDRYKVSLLDILRALPESVQQASIIYYAAISKWAFREGILDILKEISLRPDVSHIREIHVCMYGDKFHLIRRWTILCEIFKALTAHDDSSLGRLRQSWLTQHGAIAPFFEWF